MRIVLIALFFISAKPFTHYAFIKQQEGTRFKAYKDSKGWALCYGNRFYVDGSQVKKGDRVSKNKCHTIFVHHIKKRVLPYISHITLDWNKEVALVSFLYRHGVYHKKSKGIIRCVEENNYSCVESYIRGQRKVPNRARAELKVWKNVL